MTEYLDCDLITLAYWYLQKKQKQTKKIYTIADIFTVSQKILQWSENNGCKKNRIPKIEFKKGIAKINKEIIYE